MKIENNIANVPNELFKYIPNICPSEIVEVEGNVQKNYINKKESVIHISPACRRVSLDESFICERWVSDNKVITLTNNLNSIGEWSARNEVSIPKVSRVGTIDYDNIKYDYWQENFIDGKNLSQAIFDGFSYEGYLKIINWISEFHHHYHGEKSLIDYYEKRLSAFQRLFSPKTELSFVCGDQHSDFIRKIVDENLNKLKKEEVVETKETKGIIHGDLRGNNILVRNNKDLGIIDFEQGTFGGDWFCDLSKLLEYFNNKLPDPNKPYFYRPPLSLDDKLKLTREYTQKRQLIGWDIPNFIAQYVESGDFNLLLNRYNLINLDTILSLIVLRQGMGWDFYKENIEGKELRGVKFLLEKFIKDYE